MDSIIPTYGWDEAPDSDTMPDEVNIIEEKSSFWPRRTMDSIRVSEAPDSGSIPDEATRFIPFLLL